MPNATTAADVLNKEFLDIRCRILDLAAMLDRLDRAGGNLEGDRRMKLIRQGIDALRGNEPSRAEQVQLLFSIPYEPKWRETLPPEKRF